MLAHMPLRVWTAAVTGGFVSLLGLTTLLWPDWIELVSGMDPDGGSGALEWRVVASCVVIASASAAFGRPGRRRARAA